MNRKSIENEKNSVRMPAEISGGTNICIWLKERQIIELPAQNVNASLLCMEMQRESSAVMNVI